MSQLRQLGGTQQRLLRFLLQQPSGAGVEALCERLHISHNAVRQHLSALIRRDWVQRRTPAASGGRPQARFELTAKGRELFPRNYALISSALLEEVGRRLGETETAALLATLGRQLGAQHAERAQDVEVTTHLAGLLDQLGYEALAVERDGVREIEAFNCVFHAIAARQPQVCQFDLAFMEAASGHRIRHMECIIRGGGVCRFRIGEKLASPPA